MEKLEEYIRAKKDGFRWFFDKAVTLLDELGNSAPWIAVILCGQAFEVLGKKFKQAVAQDAVKREPTTTKQKIEIEFVKKNISGAEIGRRMGVSRVAIYQVISGKTKSKRLRKAIAEAIGMEVSDLWPENKNSSKAVK